MAIPSRATGLKLEQLCFALRMMDFAALLALWKERDSGSPLFPKVRQFGKACAKAPDLAARAKGAEEPAPVPAPKLPAVFPRAITPSRRVILRKLHRKPLFCCRVQKQLLRLWLRKLLARKRYRTPRSSCKSVRTRSTWKSLSAACLSLPVKRKSGENLQSVARLPGSACPREEGRHQGIVTIVFKTGEGVRRALEKNGMQHLGRPLKVAFRHPAGPLQKVPWVQPIIKLAADVCRSCCFWITFPSRRFGTVECGKCASVVLRHRCFS
ncbi:unnamed protein product [Symbiodinium sp. CCMP2592]|nr:unnamed protein product [Symbiodinium sp. CCMP2592]